MTERVLHAAITIIFLLSAVVSGSSQIRSPNRRKNHHHRQHHHQEETISFQVQVSKISTANLFGITKDNDKFTDVYDVIEEGIIRRMEKTQSELECSAALYEREQRYKDIFDEVYKLFYSIRSVTDNNIQPSTSKVRRNTEVDRRNYTILAQNEVNNLEEIQQLQMECKIIEFCLHAKSNRSEKSWTQAADMMQKVSDILQVDTNLNVVYDKLFEAIKQKDPHQLDPSTGSYVAENVIEKHIIGIRTVHTTFYELKNSDDGDCLAELIIFFKELAKDYKDDMLFSTNEVEDFIKTTTSVRNARCYRYILKKYTQLYAQLYDKYDGILEKLQEMFPDLSCMLAKRSLQCTCIFECKDLKKDVLECSQGKKECGFNKELIAYQKISRWWDQTLDIDLCQTGCETSFF